MKTKTIIILLCLVTQVLQTNGLIQLKNSLANSDSPLLKKILELVDAAINDEHLLQVTLKLLRSLCICMRETLKAKESNVNFGNYPLDLNESSGTAGKVFDLYKNIYNNTCFNLRQDLTNRTYKFIVDEEAEFLNHTNCGKDDKNETIVKRDDTDKSPAVKHSTTSRLEQVLFKALIQTKDLHVYRLRKYNLFSKGTPQLKRALQHILIVILTLNPNKQELTSRKHNIDEKDFNNTLYTKSPIDIDIISTDHDQKRKEKDQAIKAENLSECNLQSLYISLTESDRNNQIKVFKLIRKRDTIKIYTEVKLRQNHTDLINICCKNGTTVPQCNREIINDFITQPKFIDENYKNTITKIRSLVNQYEHKLNDTTHHNISTTVQDEKKEENIITESTAKQSGTNADRINHKDNDIHVSVTNSKESSKLGEVTQAIVLLNDFVSKKTTKTYSQTYQTDRTDSFKPWTAFMLKEDIQQDITTPYNYINIGTALNVKGQEEKSHRTSITSLAFFENKKDAKIGNYAPKNAKQTTMMFKEYETSNKQEKTESLGVTLPMSQEKHETEEKLRQTSTSRTDTVYMSNTSYSIDSSPINNDVNTDLYTMDVLQNSIIANQVNGTVAPTLNDTDKLSEFTTPQLITGKKLIPDLGINQYDENDYEAYLLGNHIIKVSDSSSTTISSTEQSTETTLHHSPGLNLVNFANNTTLWRDLSTLIPIYNNSLYSGVQTINDAQNISEALIIVNSTAVTKSIPESELMNETFAIEKSNASDSNAIPSVISTYELSEKVNEIGQHFTLGESIIDDVIKPKELKTITSDSPATKNISETTIQSTFQNIAPNTTFKSVTTPESYRQSVPGDMEDIITNDRVTKAEPTSIVAFYITVEEPNEKKEPKTFTLESLESNKISEATMTTSFQNVAINTKPESLTTLIDDMDQSFLYEETTMKTKFKNIATNMTLESLTTLDLIKSHNQSGSSDPQGINITDRVTKAETMSPFAYHIIVDVPTEQTDTKTFASEYLETNNISEPTIKIITNTTPELLTKFPTFDFTNSQNQSVNGDVEGINIVGTVSKAESTSSFASHIMADAPHEQTETKTFTSESLETNKISETTIQNVAVNTKPESLTTVDFTKSPNLSFVDDMGGTNIIDRVRVTKAKPMSIIDSHVNVDELNEQTETKTFTLESLETNIISKTTMKTNFKNIATNTTLESLTALSTIDSTKSQKQSVYDDTKEIETTDIVTKAEPMSTFASHIRVEVHNEQTKNSTSESPETSNISKSTMKTTFWNVTTNTTLELLTKLSTLGFPKLHNKSIHDDIEGINTIDRITNAEPFSTFASDVSILDDVVHQTETKTCTSESPAINKNLKTTTKTTLQNIGTNMTLALLTSLSTLDSTKPDHQAVYDDIEGIDTELMSTFASHVTVDEPFNYIGQNLRKNVTKNSIIKISTTESTLIKFSEDLNETYNGMHFDMLDDFFEEGGPDNYTNAGTETNKPKTNEQSYMTTGLPGNTEENTVITQGSYNEITIKSTDILTSVMEPKITTEFYKEESNKVNSTIPNIIYTNPGTDTNTQSYKTTALSVETEETIVNTQDTFSTFLQNVTDNEITLKSTDTVTPEQEFRMITEFSKEEPNKHNDIFPGIISTQSVPNTEAILQSEIVSTYSGNLPKSRDTVEKQNNQSTELFYTAISTETYGKTVREDYTTLIPTLIKHSVTTSNLEFNTSDDIQNTESADIQTVSDASDITFFDHDYVLANNLARPEILSAKTNTLSEALVMERNENNLKSEPVNIKENNILENTSIFSEATTGIYESNLSSEKLETMNLTTNLSFIKCTLPLDLEKDTLQKELETEDTETLNDTLVITINSAIEGIRDAPSRNDSSAPQEELVENKLFHKNVIMVSNTSLEESHTLKKNLSSSLQAKLNETNHYQKESEIEVTVAFHSTFETSTNSEMEKIGDTNNQDLSEIKIKVPKNDSESLAQEESVVNRLLDKDVYLLFHSSPEESFTSKNNVSEISLDFNTYTESVQKVDNGLNTLLNQHGRSIIESSSPYLSSTEITPTDLPGFTSENITIIANITADNLLAEHNATFIHKELYTMPESGSKQPTTDTFTVALNSTNFFTKQLNNALDMEETTLGIIAQQDQTDVSLPMPTSIIAVGSSLESIAKSILKHKDMKEVTVPRIRTKNHQNVLDDIIVTAELIASSTHTETTIKYESRYEDFDYFGNDGTTLTIGNETSTKNIAVNDSHENLQEKRMPGLSTATIITTTERSTLETLIIKNLSSSQTLPYRDPITTESKPEMIDIKNDTNVENKKDLSLFTPELVISDLLLLTPSTLSSTEVMQDTLIKKQLITSDMRTKESTLFTTVSDLRVSTPAPLSSMEVMQSTTKRSDMNIKQISESPNIGTTQYSSIEALQRAQLDAGPYATITGPIFGANEATKTEKLAQLNDFTTHITTEPIDFMSQPVYKDYMLFEEETESSIEPTTSKFVKMQFYSDENKITPVYDMTESIINARLENASTESFSFESHIQESTIVNKPFTSHVMESTKISPKSVSTFTQANENYTEKTNHNKRSKTLKRKIKSKKPIAFELNIRVGVESNKDGIKFSVLDEKETVIHEQRELRLPEPTHLNFNQSDNDIQDTLLGAEIEFANETVNNNTTSLRIQLKEFGLKNMTRRSHNVTNEDLRRVTEILKKLSWNPPAKTQRRRKFQKHTKTRKSFAGNSTINEKIQLDQVNTTNFNATTTSTHKNFTNIRHKSVMPGALTEQHEITNISSIYKKHFEKLKERMNYTKNVNKISTDALKKTYNTMLSLPVTENLENTLLNTTGVNHTLHKDQEDLEVDSRTLGSAKNYSVKSEPTLNKNKISITSEIINKKIEIILKKLMKGKKLNKHQLRKFKKKLLKNVMSKKNITSVHKFHDTVKKKNDVNMTNTDDNTVTLTTTNKYTMKQADNVTGIPNVEVFTPASSSSEKPNPKIVSFENNKTQTEEKIRKGIDKQAAVMAMLNTTSKGILQGRRRLFDTHSNKSLFYHEIEQESSKFEAKTTYQNTSTDTNISIGKVTAITSNEEASLSEMILEEIDEDLLKPENESIKDTSETLNKVTLNSSDALTKIEVKKESLSLLDTHHSDLMEELNGVLIKQNKNKTLTFRGVDSTSTIVTDAKNTTVKTNSKSSNSETRYGISEKIITAPFQSTAGFYGTVTTPFFNTEFKNNGQNEFSSDKEDLRYTVPMTTVKANTFDKSVFQSDDNATTVNFSLTSSILTVTNVPRQINEPNDNNTKTEHKVTTNIRDTKHYFKDKISDQSPKSSEFFLEEDYRRAENFKNLKVTSIQQINDVSSTLLPHTGKNLSFTTIIPIFTDTNHNKYEGIETTTSIPSASATTNNSQDIILRTPSKFDILTTYHPDAQPSIINMSQPIVTEFPGTHNISKIKAIVADISLDMEIGRNVNDGNLSVNELKYFNAKSITNSSTIDYISTSTLNYEELKSTDQMFISSNVLLPEDQNSSINQNVSAEYNFTSTTDIFKHITDSVESTSTLVKEMHKEKQNRNKNILKEITNKVNNDSEIIKTSTTIYPCNNSMNIGQEIILCLGKKIIDEFKTFATVIQDLNITTQHPIEEYFINFADDERENKHSSISTVGTEEYIEATTDIPDVSAIKRPFIQIPPKTLKTEKVTERHVNEIQMRNAKNYNNTTTFTKNTYKQHLSTNTKTIKISSDSSPITTEYIIAVSDKVNQYTNVSSDASTHGDKSSSTEIREHEKIVENPSKKANKTQLFYIVDQSVNVSSTETRNIMNSSKTDLLLAQNRTKEIQNSTSINNTKRHFFVKAYDGEKKISVISTPTLTHLKVTQMNPVNKTTVDLKPEVQKLLLVSSNKVKLITDRTNKNGTKRKGYQSHYKSVFPNVESMEFMENIRSGNINNKILKMEIFSSRLNRPHKLLPTTTACTKNIKYNTYRPITKEELEILKYFSDPILNTVLHKQVEDKPQFQVAAFNHSDAAMESGRNFSLTDTKTILRAVNNSEAKQKVHAKNRDRADKDPHPTLATHKNLNQSIKIVKIPHSSEINRISHPILEININSPQIRTNGNSPPMIEINGNPLPIEINQNSAPIGINGNSAPLGMNGNYAPMGINGNSAPIGINSYSSPTVMKGNSSPMGENRNYAPMGINGNSAPLGMNGNYAPMGMNGNYAPMSTNGNSALMEMNGNYAPMGINGNSAPIGINENYALVGINGNSAPVRMNKNYEPMGINGNSAPIGINENYALVGINGNSAPMRKNKNYEPMGINGNSAPIGINENYAPMGINGNSAPMVMNSNSSPTVMKSNSSPMSVNRNYGPMGINGNSAPIGINENYAPMGINGNSAPMVMNSNSSPTVMKSNSSPMGVNRNYGPMGINGNLAPLGMNGNYAPMGINVNYAPMAINRNSAPMGLNGNSAPMGMNENFAPMAMNVNSGPMRMDGKSAPIGANGNSLILDITRNPVPMEINGNSLMIDISRNSASMGTKGNSAPMRINGNSMTMNINRNPAPMGITNNSLAKEMNGNQMPMGNNGDSVSIGTNKSPLPIVMNGNQLSMGTNGDVLPMGNSGNSVPIRMNDYTVPIGINKNSLIIDSVRNPVPMITSGNSMTMNINRKPVPIELKKNSIPLGTNGNSVTKVADRTSEPLGNNENPMPMNSTRNSVQMGINGNSVPLKINLKNSPMVNNGNLESVKNSEPVEILNTSIPMNINITPVPMEVNKTSVPSEINKNPAPKEATKNQILTDIKRNSVLMELKKSSIQQKNNRNFNPQETNNNSNSKDIKKDLPRILETNRNISPTTSWNRKTLSMMNTGNNLNLSPTNDKNRSTFSMDEKNKNVLFDNDNLSSTANKPWILASMFNNDGISPATKDSISNLPQIFYKDQNSLFTPNRNKNSPSIIDINRYSLVVNKNSPTIIHNKWNLPSVMGNNKEAPSMADNINAHSINNNRKSILASGNNMNAHSVIDNNEKSSKNIDNKKTTPSGTRDQDNNKNSLSVETNKKSPLINYLNQIAHSTVKSNIISTTETKTSEAIVATKKKILPMKEIKRKPFLTFESNKKPFSITGNKIKTHGTLKINRNTHSKFVSKNYKRIGSHKEKLLDSFENRNPYTAKIKEPNVQTELKQMKIGTRRKPVMTINTQDFISQHRYVTPRSVLQKTTKPYSMFLKPQRLIQKSKTLIPKFDSIDKPAKRLGHKMKPKLVFHKGRSGQNIQRIGMMPKRARVNNVLDMPARHTTLKPKYLKDRNDAMNFMFDDEFKKTRRPDSFGNNYNPSPSFRRKNMEQPTTESGRKRQRGRTIFFLSPTEAYDQYN